MTVAKKQKKSQVQRKYKAQGRSSSAGVGAEVKRQVAMQVERLVEKKQDTKYTGTSTLVGQVNGNASGHLIYDITPTPLQGTTNTDRIGDKVAVTGISMKFLVYQQNGTSSPLKIRVSLFKVIGQPLSSTEISNDTAIQRLFNPNVFIEQMNAGTNEIYDTEAERNSDYFKNFRLVRMKEQSFAAEGITSQVMTYNFDMPISFKNNPHVVNYDQTPQVSSGQLLLVVQANSGNKSSSTACTLAGVPSTAINSATYFAYNIRHYFTDM